MWDDHPNTEQILLRLPKPMFEALIQRSAELALLRTEKVSVQKLIKEILNKYLLASHSDRHPYNT